MGSKKDNKNNNLEDYKLALQGADGRPVKVDEFGKKEDKNSQFRRDEANKFEALLPRAEKIGKSVKKKGMFSSMTNAFGLNKANKVQSKGRS